MLNNDTSWMPCGYNDCKSDEQVLAVLMKKYFVALYNFANRFSKDDALIKDCIQEVFISLWQRRENAAAILLSAAGG